MPETSIANDQLDHKPLYFDVTEIVHGSSGRVNYGIMRVVLEIADELAEKHPDTKFVLASQKNGSLIPVPRHRLKSTVNDIRVANSQTSKPSFLPKFAADRLGRNFKRLVRRIGKSDRLGSDTAGVFVSASRPKLMRGFLTEHPKKYPQLDFAPLLHDVLPMRHDLSKRKAAYLQRFKNDTSLAINSANLLLSNSEHTLNEVQHFSDLGLLPPLPDRKKAIPLAHELKLPPKEHAANASSVPANFILTVGSSLGRKNMEVVLRAVESMAENANAPNLVVAGSKVSSIRNWMQKNSGRAVWPKIHFIHNPNDSMLLHLYKQASAFVLPSKDEGWGLPAGEALWHGVPVIASDIPIMRELGGARLLYFDPDSVDELSQRIDAVCNQRATSSSTFTARRPIRRGLRCWAQVAHELVEAVL